MISALYEEPEDYINYSGKLMHMYGDRPIRQPSLSSNSYCSSSTSFSSSPSADQLGNSSNTITTIKPAQVPSMSNEVKLMNPSSCSLQVPAPTTMVNSFNQLNMLNQLMGLNDMHSGNAFTALDVNYQINNTCHPAPSQYASHDQSHLSGTFAPYISSTNHAEASTALPSLSEPDTQHHQLHYESYDHNYFLQCAYSNDDQVLDAYNSLQYMYAHEIAGLGSSHEESIVVHSQLEVTGMNMPLGTCAETSQSASQSNDQKPQCGNNIYSSINGGGTVSTDTFGGLGQAAHELSTLLSTGYPAAPSSLADHNLRAKDKLEHSVALMGETERRTLMKLTNPGLGAYQEAFIPNHDQGGEIASLSAGLTTICPAAGTNYIGDSGYGSADKADYRMQQEGEIRIKEQIIRGSSGLSNMEAHYVINKISGLQELQEGGQGDQNVSSASTPQSIKQAEDHKHAERKRRRKQGDCYDTLRRVVPIIPKKKADKVAVLKSTIEYIKKLESELELYKEKVALGNMNNKESQGELERCCYSQEVNIVINSSPNISSPTATCEYIHSSCSREILPHFLLKLATSAKNVNANNPIIDITTALQEKNLHCFELKLEFLKSTSFGATILAVYIKDGESCTPNLDEIQEIEQWWTHIIDQLSAKWKL